ncbi:cation diffusion facilitator family transporter [Lactococcus formosensis]|uniref:cation diffusion facilitator family transporter n=1 Tax=Lactococcus formosensis TaxID=1281486 RepID=UPI001BCB0F84|nr:cation diffusion facilitator family transporter [Lactococcus formosensis]
MENKRYKELKIAEKGAWISISAYIILAFTKIFMGIFANSEALRADGLNNFTDVIASVSVLIGLKLARKPKDNDHRYGHWKFENIASMVTSFIMLMVGIEVLYSSFEKIVNNSFTPPHPLSALVGIGSALVMVIVYIYNSRLAKKVNSQALMAAAKDNLSDAYTSIGAAVAIAASYLHFYILDTVAAFIIGIIIIKTAVEIFRESSFTLSDGFPEKDLEKYKKDILKIPGVKGVPFLRGRTYGANIFLDIVIYVDAQLSVAESHLITEEIEKQLSKKFEVFDIDVHVEPFPE